MGFAIGKNDMIESEYWEYLYNTRVALIGGYDDFDPHAFDYDVVVRVNDHWTRQGGRVDVLYNLCNQATTDAIASFGHTLPDYLVLDANGGGFHQIKSWAEDYKVDVLSWRKDRFSAKDHWWFELRELQHEFGQGDPFTGTTALYHLLQHSMEEVFVTGMSLFTHLSEENKPPACKSHNPYANAMVLAHLGRLHKHRLMYGQDVIEAITHYTSLE